MLFKKQKEKEKTETTGKPKTEICFWREQEEQRVEGIAELKV